MLEAIEIGARVLDREQTGANAEFVKAEFEKTARELDTAFVERAGASPSGSTRSTRSSGPSTAT